MSDALATVSTVEGLYFASNGESWYFFINAKDLRVYTDETIAAGGKIKIYTVAAWMPDMAGCIPVIEYMQKINFFDTMKNIMHNHACTVHGCLRNLHMTDLYPLDTPCTDETSLLHLFSFSPSLFESFGLEINPTRHEVFFDVDAANLRQQEEIKAGRLTWLYAGQPLFDATNEALKNVFSLPLGLETVQNLIQEATEAFIELQGDTMKHVIARELMRGLQAKRMKEGH